MAPMNRNRNRDQQKATIRGRDDKIRRACKGSVDSNRSRIRKRIAVYKYDVSSGGRRGVIVARSRNMGAARYSKIAQVEKRKSVETDEQRTKKYIRKALELGLSAGYLIPNDNTDRQVFRVASDFVTFGPCLQAATGSDEKPMVTGGARAARGRNRDGLVGARKKSGKRLGTKNLRGNVRKRGRSRTKSPKRSVGQKRRRKQSDGRRKVKARIQKRKRAPTAKNDDERRTGRGNDTDEGENEDDEEEEEDDDDGNKSDEDNEPSTVKNDDKNARDANKKLPGAGRPVTVAPNSEKSQSTSGGNGKTKKTSANDGNGTVATADQEEKSSDDGDEDEEGEEEEDDEDEEKEDGGRDNGDGGDEAEVDGDANGDRGQAETALLTDVPDDNVDNEERKVEN